MCTFLYTTFITKNHSISICYVHSMQSYDCTGVQTDIFLFILSKQKYLHFKQLYCNIKEDTFD